MDKTMLSILLGIGSAVGYGTGDFSGAIATRRHNLYGVVIVSQCFGLLMLAAIAIVLGEIFPPVQDMIGGGVAGIIGAVGLLALYRALSTGRMGLTAPISAMVTGMLPVLFGLFTQGLPPWIRLVGLIIALPAIWLVSRPEGAAFDPRQLILPVIAGCCFGSQLVLISQITTTSTLYPLVAARFVSVIALIIVATVRREPWWPAPRMLGLLAIVGAFDSAGNAFFALSAKVGRLDVASVISSLYPAITVALAWAFLKEKMNGEQRFGIVLALIAITLIALPA